MKDKRLYLRVTEDEKYQLKIKADIAHMSISEYIITLSENKKIYTVDQLPKLIFEISKIGTNVNQVVHGINYEHRVSGSDIKVLQDKLTEVQDLLLKLVNELTDSEEKNNGLYKDNETEDENS
mgnify:CR=1 FL=1